MPCIRWRDDPHPPSCSAHPRRLRADCVHHTLWVHWDAPPLHFEGGGSWGLNTCANAIFAAMSHDLSAASLAHLQVMCVGTLRDLCVLDGGGDGGCGMALSLLYCSLRCVV